MHESTMAEADSPRVVVSYYELLGIADSADAAVIRKRYRALALESHPDRFESAEQKVAAATKFKSLREAYEVLADTEQRRRYDTSRARGKVFVPTESGSGAEQSLADIFGDVDRFSFPATVKSIADAGLRSLINESIVRTDTLKEKVIAVYDIVASDVVSSTATNIRGQSAAAKHLVLTNFRVIVALAGQSSLRSGNATLTGTYLTGLTTTLMNISRLDFLVGTRNSTGFNVTFFGPETPLTGTQFTLRGSPAPFLWMANLFAIQINVQLDVPTNETAYRVAAWASGLLGGTIFLTILYLTDVSPATILAAVPVLGLAVATSVHNLQTGALARLYRVLGA